MGDKICNECNGNGVFISSCPSCGGHPSKTEDGNCDRCANEGFVELTCPACNGSGSIETE